MGRRLVQSDAAGYHAVLYPAVAEAAGRRGASSIGLLDVGSPAGLNLSVDRVGLAYDGGPTLGDPSSPVRLSPAIVHRRPVPARAMPPVVARIGLDRDPVDVTDPGDAGRLRACLRSDQPERRARLDAEIALTATAPPLLRRGDPVGLLPDAIAQVPAGALPVVITTWALSRFSVGRRLGFLRQLESAGAVRPLAWVSAEGVGVAPAIPTLGDRPASGHSIIGLAVFGSSAPPTLAPAAEALGRCWSRGRLLEWLADA